MTGDDLRRILVIKLGALGDFTQAFGPFQAIRQHHPDARISLLTTRPFAALAAESPWFDEVLTDRRPGRLDLPGWLALRRTLRSGGFFRVYDLQTSTRSGRYRRLFFPGPSPEWSGIAPGCSHPHRNPDRDHMHTIDRQAEQLRDAGIPETPPPTTDWIDSDLNDLDLPDRFALIAPGGSAHRPEKRWPAAHYQALVATLAERGLTPVLIGSAGEAALHQQIIAGQPAALSLAGRTRFQDIVALARKATLAVGNDTGPMHLVALTRCPALVLFSAVSDPDLCAPRGAAVALLRSPSLADLSPAEVVRALGKALP
ncbi:MAG: glycosyltransferase family 9 protein [Rhodospirillales bacterium]